MTPPPDTRLEDDVPRCSREWAEMRNLLVARQLQLSHVLGLPFPPFRLVPAGPEDGVVHWLLIEGREGRLAQFAVSSELGAILGAAPHLRAAVVDALAARLVAPVLPGLNAFFGQPVSIRVVPAEDIGDTHDWFRFRLFLPDYRFSEPCRLHPAFLGALRARAISARRFDPFDVDVPLFVGRQLRLRSIDVLALKAGDLLVDDSSDAAIADLCFDARAGARCGGRMAAVDAVHGVVRHVVPRHLRTSTGHGRAKTDAGGDDGVAGTRIAVDIVLAWLTASARTCSRLVPGGPVPGWADARWLPRPALLVAGRCVASLNRVTVAGVPAFEVAADQVAVDH
jgi:hypothetical protein